jgi:hypothetical protein
VLLPLRLCARAKKSIKVSLVWFVVHLASITFILVIVVAEIVSRVKRSSSFVAVGLAHLPQRIVTQRWLMRLALGLMGIMTALAGIYATVAIAPKWGPQWLPIVVAVGTYWLVFRDAADAMRVLPVLPVMELLKRAHWPVAAAELAFRDLVAADIEEAFAVRPQPERPLSSGTRVDLWFELHDYEYFISIKRHQPRAANQQRLILQGEIEDILADVRARKVQRFHVGVLIGVTPDERRAMHQLGTLETQLLRRILSSSSCLGSVFEIQIGQAAQEPT